MDFGRYEKGVAVFVCAGHTFRLLNHGTILMVGEQRFDIGAEKPTLRVAQDGTVEVLKYNFTEQSSQRMTIGAESALQSHD